MTDKYQYRPRARRQHVVLENGEVYMSFPSSRARARYLRICQVRGFDPFGVDAVGLFVAVVESAAARGHGAR